MLLLPYSHLSQLSSSLLFLLLFLILFSFCSSRLPTSQLSSNLLFLLLFPPLPSFCSSFRLPASQLSSNLLFLLILFSPFAPSPPPFVFRLSAFLQPPLTPSPVFPSLSSSPAYSFSSSRLLPSQLFFSLLSPLSPPSSVLLADKELSIVYLHAVRSCSFPIHLHDRSYCLGEGLRVRYNFRRRKYGGPLTLKEEWTEKTRK